MTEHKIIEVEAPIQEVVVYEDRAQITRRATVKLPPGKRLVRASGLTPLLCDRTLRCQAPEGARLLDLRVERTYRTLDARPHREQELRKALKARLARYREALDLASGRAHERHLLDLAAEELITQLQERLTVGEASTSWTADLDRLGKKAATLEQEMLKLQWAQDDRRRRIIRALEELADSLSPAPEYRAALITAVEAQTGGQVELAWQYQVPCALWRPAYDAELSKGEADKATVAWRSHGTVWQRTGEAWEDVALTFSTERPALGATLPLLEDDHLHLRERSRQERDVLEIESRDQVIQKADEVGAERRQDDTPPGLEDGGEPRHYTAEAKVTIPSDGRPHRVRVGTWDAEAELELACLPEKARYVFMRSFQVNPDQQLPLLAGPVSLVREGGYVGRSRIGYVAPSERFTLSWGSEDDLTVLREVSDEQRRGSLLGGRREELTRVKLVVANQGEDQVEVELYERVPVSEIEAVKVKVDKETTAGYHLDDDGLVNWKLELGPGHEEEVRLAFSVNLPDKAQVSE